MSYTDTTIGSLRHKSTMEWIAISDMRISPEAQREYRPAFAARIVAEFNLEALGHPVINRRDGHYYIVDRQHRIAALKMLGLKDDRVECECFSGLTIQQEAELFLRRNTRRAVRSYDKFRIGITAARKDEVEINRIVKEQGLTVAGNRANGSISAVATLKKIYDRSGGASLSRTLGIVRDAFGQVGLDGDTLDGVSLVILRYGDDLDDAEAVAGLSKVSGGHAGLIGRAQQTRRQTRSPKVHCIAAAVEAINSERSRGHKLTSWWRVSE